MGHLKTVYAIMHLLYCCVFIQRYFINEAVLVGTYFASCTTWTWKELQQLIPDEIPVPKGSCRAFIPKVSMKLEGFSWDVAKLSSKYLFVYDVYVQGLVLTPDQMHCYVSSLYVSYFSFFFFLLRTVWFTGGTWVSFHIAVEVCTPSTFPK